MAKRGRLSAIERMPPEADEVIRWAADMLTERRLPQRSILAGFNFGLAELGFRPVSRTAFNRFAQQARSGGLPARFRSPARSHGNIIAVLVELIDERIAVALQARAPQP
ncbi:MAG: phage protein Gp27 family protein [Gammaproteobacteria bacterium]